MGVPNKSTRTKTRRKTRDLDQIFNDLKSPKHLEQYKITKAEEDLPALGRWYCVECAKWFDSETNLVAHRKGSNHKRQLKALKEGPYSQQEAEAAIGLRTDYSSRNDAQTTEVMEVEMKE